jgi:hypothetical protein
MVRTTTFYSTKDKFFIGWWPIEMYFELGDVEGGRHNNWYHGTVLEVVNAMRRTVRIMWNETCLAENDENVIFKALLITLWNPKVAKLRSWREYLGKI